MNRHRASAALEATANLRSRIAVGVVVAGAVLAAVCATTILSLAEVEGVLEQQQARVDRGEYVFQIMDEERRPFGGGDCDSVNSIEGVVAGGGMSASRSVDVMFDQGANYSVDKVTAGFARVIWPETPPMVDAATVAGSSVADRFGLSGGAELILTDGSIVDEVVTIGATASASNRDRRYDARIALIVPPTEDVVLCLVEATPGAQRGVGAVLDSAFPADEGFVVLPLALSDNSGRTPQEQLENRITRWTPLAAGLLAVALLVGSWLARSGEFALYRFLGFSRMFVLRLLLVEALYLIWSPAAAGAFLALAIAPPGSSFSAGLVASDLASLALVTVTVVPIGIGLLALRSPARMLKDVV